MHDLDKKLPLSSILIVLLLLLFCPVGNEAISKELVLKENVHKYMPGKYIEYLEDKDKSLSIYDIVEEVTENDFQQSMEMVPRFGFTSSAYWFRLSIRNLSNDDKSLFFEVTQLCAIVVP